MSNSERSLSIMLILIVICGIILQVASCWLETIPTTFSTDRVIISMLGIQATISTLSIMLISLLTIIFKESYLGINYADYYSNIHNKCFTQKRVVHLAIGLVFLNAYLYFFNFFYLIIYIFFAELYLLIYSTENIFSIFESDTSTRSRIHKYFRELFTKSQLSKIERERIKNIFNGWDIFFDGTEYKKALGIYQRAIYYMVKKKAIALESLCARTIYHHLKNENAYIKKRGIEILNITYQILVNLKVKDYRCNVLGQVENALGTSIELIPITENNDNYSWNELSTNIIKFALFSHDSTCLRQLENFYVKYPYFIKANNSPIDVKNEHLIKNLFDFSYDKNDIPEGDVQLFLFHKCRMSLCYLRSLLLCGSCDVIGKYIYFSNKYFKFDSAERVFLLFAFHCYLYYLSEKEEERIISSKIRDSSRRLLECKDMQSAMNNALNSDFYFCNPEKLLELLNGFEYITPVSKKILIMEDVVKEWCTLMTLCAKEDNFSVFFKEDVYSYYRIFLSDKNEHEASNIIKRFYKLLNAGSAETDVKGKYDILKNTLIACYKKEKIDSLKKNTVKFNARSDKLKFCLKDDIINNIKSKFIDIVDDEIINATPQRFTSDISFPTSLFLIDMYHDSICESIIEDFFKNICVYLKSKLIKLQRVDSNSFAMLKNYDLAIGSFIFDRFEYHSKFSTEFSNGKRWIKISGPLGIIIDSKLFKFNIANVEVNFKSETDDFSQDDGCDEIQTLNFTDKETREYISNSKKIIEVLFDVLIEIVGDSDIGYIVTNQQEYNQV